jgi:signal transduction histidine kinase
MVRRQALRRVLGNLIDNALNYGGTAEVSAWRSKDGAMCMAVCDRGPGIPDDQLEQVLQPFYRLEGSRSRDTGGTGLGLAIAAQLMRAIGGSLQLSNLEGGGLAAVVTLP